jgi:hypothetical protein
MTRGVADECLRQARAAEGAKTENEHRPPSAARFVKGIGLRRVGSYSAGVKHITYAGKSMFTGDDVADLLVEYAAALAHAQDGDSVNVRVISLDGNEVEASFLLDTGAPLMSESTNSTLPDPDNADAVEYMRRRIMELENPQAVQPQDQTMPASYEELHLSDGDLS